MSLWLAIVLALWANVAGAEVQYAAVDRATVKVLALHGVEMLEQGKARDKTVRLAVAKGGHGSGVKVSSDGLIITAQHVIDGARVVVVKEPGSDKAYPAEVVYQSRKHDLAFLAIPGAHSEHLPLPETPPVLQVRQTVFALGYPLDPTRKNPQSNRGVVAGTLPDGGLQLGISVNPGNSGGPVIDENDQLVGIVVRSADPKQGAQGIGHAVSMDRILKSYQSRILNGTTFRSAQSRLARTTPSEWAAAAVAARVAEQSTLGTAIEKIEGLDDGQFSWQAQQADEATKQSPDLAAILAAHYWNESMVRYVLEGGAWTTPLQRAKALATRALKLDPEVGRYSPFVLTALGKRRAPVVPPDRQSRAGVPRKEAPAVVAGFRLGASVAETRRACELEEHEFTKSKRGYRCSGAAKEFPLPVQVSLGFCSEKLCRIDLLYRPANALSAPWKEEFGRLMKHYEKHFGRARRDRVHFPRQCARNLVACLERGKAVMIYSWNWPARTLELSMGRVAGKAAIRISHRPLAK